MCVYKLSVSNPDVVRSYPYDFPSTWVRIWQPRQKTIFTLLVVFASLGQQFESLNLIGTCISVRKAAKEKDMFCVLRCNEQQPT